MGRRRAEHLSQRDRKQRRKQLKTKHRLKSLRRARRDFHRRIRRKGGPMEWKDE